MCETNAHYTASTLKLICAWCGCVMRDGKEPASHGICPACLAKVKAAA